MVAETHARRNPPKELTPGEDRLFQLRDAGLTAGQELAELVDQRRCWRMDVPAVEAEADHPARALGNPGEAEGVLPLNIVKRDTMDGSNLRRVGNDRRALPRPHHDRRDQVAGAGRVIV